jgi:pyruvate/2-oxoglutarate dehydrogenase complex dihydrolipoamide acyltransferase (E2) component
MAAKKAATTTTETAAAPAAKAVKTTKTTAAPKAVKAEKAADTTANTTQVTLNLPKAAVESAKTVVALGDFNNWNVTNAISLKKQKDGSFQTTIELEAGKEYQYRFLVNGETWVNAWDAPKYVATPFGSENSVVIA